MSDVIIYFGPLELTAVVLGLILVTAAIVFWRQRNTLTRQRRALLDSLPYPALLFRGKKLAAHNAAAGGWRGDLELPAAPTHGGGWPASRRITPDEAKRLAQLVDNLLPLARLESPSFTLDRAPLNFGALLEEAILQISDLAEERRLALSLNLAPGLPRLEGDRARLKQVVLNLLDNAIKYTPSGGSITVDVRADDNRIACSVS